MPQHEFILRANVEKRYGPRAHPFAQFLPRDRLQTVSLVEKPLHHLLDLSDIVLGNLPQCCEHIENGVIGEAIANELTLAPRGHESDAPQMLEMLRGVGDRQSGFLRQNLHAALALPELFKQFQAMGMPQGLRDGGEFAEENLFWTLR